MNEQVSMDLLVSLCKRRGFIFQSSEPYGGIGGFWDYGPVGVELRNRVKSHWWRYMVQYRDNVVGLDTSIVAHPQTWVASGHVDSFSDPMVDCKQCKRRFRTDQMPDPEATKCPECGGDLTEPRAFNLMFKTYVGPVEDDAAVAYLRPETCQSIFTQFKNVVQSSRQRIPFGIAQVGKSFRNEITPRNFIFRSREFEQMEMEFFCTADKADKFYEYWINERFNWFTELGISKESLRLRPHDPDELAHYASGCTDVEYEFPFGWSELEGIANRGNYDLSQHAKHSGKDFSVVNEATNEKYIPNVVESSVGVDRTMLTIMADAYCEEDVQGEKRVVLKLKPEIAPYQVALFPLSKKLSDSTKKLEIGLRKKFATDFDAIGRKRYRRHDEIGTPFCVTYDFDSEEDKKVTVRNRDTMEQERISIDQLVYYLEEKFK
jgi:glycyl-tRNA synthetase